MSKTLRADKAYAVTADGKRIVPPSHPLARQILSHFPGQEVAINLLQNAGLATLDTDPNKVTLISKLYDEIPQEEIDAVMGVAPAASSTPAPAAPTIAEILANPDVAAAIAAEVAKQVAALKPAK